jgi:catechol 2,3-dioxygenase-like lactoylglutathione lyase family enzyme
MPTAPLPIPFRPIVCYRARAMKPEGVLESCLYAEDLEAAEAFYGRVLNLEMLTKEAGRHVFFRSGHGVVLVFNPTVTSSQPTETGDAMIPLHGTRGAGHLAFRVPPESLETWRQHLQSKNVVIESEVHWPQGGESIYFRDPAGNSIELATAKIWGLE